VFSYAPRSLEAGLLISSSTLVLVLAAFAVLAVRRSRETGRMV
jgi:hypothetical protein